MRYMLLGTKRCETKSYLEHKECLCWTMVLFGSVTKVKELTEQSSLSVISVTIIRG